MKGGGVGPARFDKKQQGNIDFSVAFPSYKNMLFNLYVFESIVSKLASKSLQCVHLCVRILSVFNLLLFLN